MVKFSVRYVTAVELITVLVRRSEYAVFNVFRHSRHQYYFGSILQAKSTKSLASPRILKDFIDGHPLLWTDSLHIDSMHRDVGVGNVGIFHDAVYNTPTSIATHTSALFNQVQSRCYLKHATRPRV